MSAPGWHPDLAASPDVLTWMWMLMGSMMGVAVLLLLLAAVKEAMNSPRCLERSCAFFSVSTLETPQRLGILARFLQWSGCFGVSLLVVRTLTA